VTVFFDFLELLCEVLSLVILVRTILSWISPGQTNILTKILYQVTEPILAPLRRIIPRFGVMDFTPLVAIVLLRLIIIFLP